MAAEHWRKFRVLFEALTVPLEEQEAIPGYRDAPFNGMTPDEGKETLAGTR